jgi:hypothetical protein
MNEQEREIVKASEVLMARIRERENAHDATTEELRININRMLAGLTGTLLEKSWFVSTLAHKLSRTQGEFNLMYRRFLDTISGDMEKSIAEIKAEY